MLLTGIDLPVIHIMSPITLKVGTDNDFQFTALVTQAMYEPGRCWYCLQ
jgi:hypothetical protein